MKNVSAIIFLLASAASFVTGTPAFSNERRAVAAQPADIAARASELAPKVKLGSRTNDTGIAARSLGLTNANSTLAARAQNSTGSIVVNRSVVIPRSVNSSDGNEARSLFARQQGNCSETESRKRSPRIRRANFGVHRSLNETAP
ncbi:hypothetical protein F4776DRAFT_658790 [Hypoxylon sp. NC0597]|nr:hypothetical protein F4776DRAFT_658790 [Hypoxylon sp. NC0597]